MIAIANQSEIDAIWPMFSERVQRGCERTGGTTSAVNLWQMCRSGNAFLIVGIEDGIKFISVWRFETWPSGVVFHCLCVCGNDIPSWCGELYDFAISQARLMGCNRLIGDGRKGWSRLLARQLKRPVKPIIETFEVS